MRKFTHQNFFVPRRKKGGRAKMKETPRSKGKTSKTSHAPGIKEDKAGAK
jgi:hypothetical protein